MHDPRKLIPVILISCALCGCGQDAEYPDTLQEMDTPYDISQTESADESTESMKDENDKNISNENERNTRTTSSKEKKVLYTDGYDITFDKPDYVYSKRIIEVKKDGMIVMTASYSDGEYRVRTGKDGYSHCEFEYFYPINVKSQYPILTHEVRDGTDIQYEVELIDELYFLHSGFQVNGKKYKYIWSNSYDSIIGIADESGQEIVRYTYGDQEGKNKHTATVWTYSDNEWIPCDDPDFIGNYNKIRNRGDYFDDETGWTCSNIGNYSADGVIGLWKTVKEEED